MARKTTKASEFSIELGEGWVTECTTHGAVSDVAKSRDAARSISLASFCADCAADAAKAAQFSDDLAQTYKPLAERTDVDEPAQEPEGQAIDQIIVDLSTVPEDGSGVEDEEIEIERRADFQAAADAIEVREELAVSGDRNASLVRPAETPAQTKALDELRAAAAAYAEEKSPATMRARQLATIHANKLGIPRATVVDAAQASFAYVYRLSQRARQDEIEALAKKESRQARQAAKHSESVAA